MEVKCAFIFEQENDFKAGNCPRCKVKLSCGNQKCQLANGNYRKIITQDKEGMIGLMTQLFGLNKAEQESFERWLEE